MHSNNSSADNMMLSVGVVLGHNVLASPSVFEKGKQLSLTFNAAKGSFIVSHANVPTTNMQNTVQKQSKENGNSSK